MYLETEKRKPVTTLWYSLLARAHKIRFGIALSLKFTASHLSLFFRHSFLYIGGGCSVYTVRVFFSLWLFPSILTSTQTGNITHFRSPWFHFTNFFYFSLSFSICMHSKNLQSRNIWYFSHLSFFFILHCVFFAYSHVLMLLNLKVTKMLNKYRIVISSHHYK